MIPLADDAGKRSGVAGRDRIDLLYSGRHESSRFHRDCFGRSDSDRTVFCRVCRNLLLTNASFRAAGHIHQHRETVPEGSLQVMHRFRLALATRYFVQPLTASIQSAAEANAQGVQFDIRNELRASELSETGRRDLLHRIAEYGLTVSGATFPLNYPLYEQDKLDIRIAAIRDAMRFAWSLKAKTLCVRIGHIPEDASSKERQVLVEVLCDLARYANHIGTVLAITPSNDSAETLKTLLNDVQTGPIGIDFDPSQFAAKGRTVVNSLRTLHNDIVHVQLRDGYSDIDGGREAAVGRGNVDWVETLALLGEMDYAGWLTSIRSEGNDPGYEMTQGLKFIREILHSSFSAHGPN